MDMTHPPGKEPDIRSTGADPHPSSATPSDYASTTPTGVYSPGGAGPRNQRCSGEPTPCIAPAPRSYPSDLALREGWTLRGSPGIFGLFTG